MNNFTDSTLSSNRLTIKTLTPDDYPMISELVNSLPWLEFVSDGKGKSDAEVTTYIAKIIANPLCTYWVIRLSDSTPIGVITFMKRDYLPHYDIGFAVLARFTGFGYAEEATRAVLQAFAATGEHSQVLATTLPSNTSSIRLLEKLGFEFVEEIRREDVLLREYSISMEIFF